MELAGKYATIWAEATGDNRCNGLVMTGAVYAEPVR